MASKQIFTQSTEMRRRRYFSDEFKTAKVQEIQAKITTIAQVSRQYQVRENSVAKWIVKYGGGSSLNGVRLIVEAESDTLRIARLNAKIAELEQLLGQKEVLLNFQVKVIETAEEMYGVDIKKKLSDKLSSDAIKKATGAGPKA